jgi:hypothetical protein
VLEAGRGLAQAHAPKPRIELFEGSSLGDDRPVIRPFALLLTALRADRQGLGAAREAARRRLGAGGARRREREAMQSRLRMSKLSQGRPENPAQACKPADRFSFSRLIEGFSAPPTPTRPRATWQEAVAVYVVIGWEPRNGDILAPPTDWLPELLRNRYIRLWIFRHRHLAAAQLISTLADAIDTARAQDRDIMLPELSAAPLVSTPPIKPAAQGRQRRNHRARGV